MNIMGFPGQPAAKACFPAETDGTGGETLKITVIISAAVSEAEAFRIKCQPGDDHKRKLFSGKDRSRIGRFKDPHMAGRKLFQGKDLPRCHNAFPVDLRDRKPLSLLQCGLQDACGFQVEVGRVVS